ncbi:hypothetical protein PPERSA_10522 [Pseudocohnilembus persalinus]|uniref:Uncharacterized protein n=1 Tax=Pseudocohnilembus persalinus TaxID=266149 RepID=A0A0V0R7F0_PSEPJ|nr:hypothetical protein PPERSA_10522 [Pseudocohnilembus persalinus]|eukprot:KRX10423.1 hypothetical protein PPERSA_10522 [Pseudocohnilembus persalinus]
MKQSKTKRERQNSNIASLVSKNHSSHIFPSLQQSPNRFSKQDDYYNNNRDNNNQNITINNNQNINKNNNQNITNYDNQVLFPKPRQKQFHSNLNLSQSQVQNSYKERGSAIRNLDVQQETRKQIQRASQLSIQMKLQGDERKVIEPEIDSQVKEQISRARNNDPDIINSLIKSYRNNQYNQTLDLIKKEACQQQNLKKGSKQMELQNFNIQKLVNIYLQKQIMQIQYIINLLSSQ